MSDRQNPYDRSEQQGGGQRGSEGYASPRQANQWQSEGRQAGGEWQQDAAARGSQGDHTRDYRFSGQADATRDTSPRQSDYGDQSADLRHQDRGSRDWQRAGTRGREPDYRGYGGRDYDASGGNDFGNFTSEDFGGRDFYNRGGAGAAGGGFHSSESYRPTYSAARLFDRSEEKPDRSTRDYGEWRRYGESRGFLERAGDEIASWFGDEDASRRRDRDHREARPGPSGSHRGRGPSDYTRSDERIREDANDHLTHDHHVDATHITVSVKSGELTLDGTVDSREAKRRAEDAVEHVSGVKHVQNNLRVQQRESGSAGSSYAGSSGSQMSGASQTFGSSASSASQSGANTTAGIGSTAGTGAGSAGTPRSSEKPG